MESVWQGKKLEYVVWVNLFLLHILGLSRKITFLAAYSKKKKNKVLHAHPGLEIQKHLSHDGNISDVFASQAEPFEVATQGNREELHRLENEMRLQQRRRSTKKNVVCLEEGEY